MGINITKPDEKKNINTKEDFELNIYFLGETISPIYKVFLSKKETKSGDIYDYWNYNYYEGSYQEQLKQIRDKFSEVQNKFRKTKIEDNKNFQNIFKEVLLVKFKKKDDEKIYELFGMFGKEFDVYCPFIIFLFDEYKDSYEKELRDMIYSEDDEYLISPLKIFAMKNVDDLNLNENTNNEYPLVKKLERICSYYNQLGDQFDILAKDEKGETKLFPKILVESGNSPTYINIICLGKTGAGKSTFLNTFFNEKRSKEGGTGQSCTTKIIRYEAENMPIRLYDIPGFEDDKTIKIVCEKLKETSKDMKNYKDKIHIILYFLNYTAETLFYNMENDVINEIKETNKNVRIIFILTHSKNDPYDENTKSHKKKAYSILQKKIDKIINNITSNFGENYSYANNYFTENSIIQENLILVNFVKDEENSIPEFGFDRILTSIYKTIAGDNGKSLYQIREKLIDLIINKKKCTPEIEKEIEKDLSSTFLLQNFTLPSYKDDVIKKARAIYNNMFSFSGKFLSSFPLFIDIKLGALSFVKSNFKRKLTKIFGYTIEDIKEGKKNEEEEEKKKKELKEIEAMISANGVSNRKIIANGAFGVISIAALSTGPIGLAIGGAGLLASSYISYKQYESDCTAIFEEFKNKYEENKYNSLYNFINVVLSGINYFQDFIINCQTKKEEEKFDSKAPNPSNVIKNMKESLAEEYSTIMGKEQEKKDKNDCPPAVPIFDNK